MEKEKYCLPAFRVKLSGDLFWVLKIRAQHIVSIIGENRNGINYFIPLSLHSTRPWRWPRNRDSTFSILWTWDFFINVRADPVFCFNLVVKKEPHDAGTDSTGVCSISLQIKSMIENRHALIEIIFHFCHHHILFCFAVFVWLNI